MPLIRIAQQPEPMPSEEQEEQRIVVKQPGPVPAEAEPMEPGRLYQAFVESSHIYPWIPSVDSPEPRMNNFDTLRRNTCYVLDHRLGRLQIYIHWIERIGNTLVYSSVPLEDLYFTPQPPAEKP